MSRTSNIRWRDEDLKELRYAISNYNRKIKRVSEQRPELAPFQPDKKFISDLKGEIKTRADFNRVVNHLKRYSKRGAEEAVFFETGAVTTKYQKKEIAIAVRAENIRRKHAREKYGFDKPKLTLTETEDKAKLHAVKPLRKEPEQYEIDAMKRFAERTFVKDFKMDEGILQMKENYLVALKEQVFGDETDLYKMVEKLNPKVLYDMIMGGEVPEIGFFYEPEDVHTIYEEAIDSFRKVV